MKNRLLHLLHRLNQTNIATLFVMILASCSMLIFVNYYTIKTLSAARAYVSGESHYAAGHTAARQYLIYYVLTSKQEYWRKFETNLDIPFGGAKARNAMRTHLDKKAITEGFIQGKNNKEDIDDMIWLFENFGSVPFFRKAVREWTKGDALNIELYLTGLYIREQVNSQKLDSSSKMNILNDLEVINNKITINQAAFSNSFGEGTRQVKNYLIIANTFFILIIIGCVSFYYAITINKLTSSQKKLKNQKNRLRTIIKDLQQTKKSLSTEIIQNKKIIGTISHDIKSPLKYIQVIAKHLISITDKSEIGYQYISSIHKSSSQLFAFTKTLVEYSKIYTEDRDYEQKTYSVFDLIDEKRVIFEEIAENYNTKIVNTTNRNLNSQINRRIISIIMHNLLDNAVKNTLNGAIEIGATTTNDSITYYVKDTGTGISQDIIDYYSNLFNNRDPEKLVLSTYGIGLHLVLELVIMLDGTIAFAAGEEGGTMVSVQIKSKKQLTS